MTGFAVLLLISSLFFNSPSEIIRGMGSIMVAPSILVTDYMVVGNIGASFFNAGILMLISIYLAHKNGVNMNGPVMAAAFTVAGFALFGKNIFNIWPVIIGVYFRSLYQKEKFSKFILPALFGTALGPLISQVSFGYGIDQAPALIAGCAIGILAGFMLPPLANHFVKFHQGFNLYNIGFTCGITGMVFMALFRSFDFENPSTLIVAEGFNRSFTIYFSVFFGIMLITGFFCNNRSLKGYSWVLKHSGRLVSDFVSLNGFGLSLVNMALLGYVSMAYVLAVGGELNGPIIGGIFTIVGFGAFGKHLKNVWPLFAGVYLASMFQIWDVNSTGALLAALFGTTLAPIAGAYGWSFGILAGIVHMSMVMNVGFLHGGMNLYNNGFSGGFVAAVLTPLFDSLKLFKGDVES
ncbi:MAG: DUF1576 domain-containing protein [Tindallia sp. MSAO_Bac2]|nr:MAG: DUF1576 domain-containing protein [Tindallia sp. MSAO_Bac2]